MLGTGIVRSVICSFTLSQRLGAGAWRAVDNCRRMRKDNAMAKATITIPLGPQTARAYDSAAPEQKRKMQALLSFWLRELAAGETLSLQQVLDDVGRKAKDRGLTPEMLDSLLEDGA